MYEQIYELDCLPFENTADARFLFESEQHREALAAIEYTVRMRKGIVLITGDIGAGKTTVTHSVCERAASFAHLVQVTHNPDAPDALLRQCLRAVGARYARNDDHGRLVERLQETAIGCVEEQRPMVLVADEAQTLRDEVLEELRLLTNLEHAGRKLIQLVLVGQPELRQRIRTPQFEPLRQRIVIAKQLRPLTLEETGAYLAHRLRVASVDPNAVRVHFTDAAVAEIFRASGGTPRVINFMADNCLLLGFVRESHEIGPAIVRAVLADMLPSFSEQSGDGTSPAPKLSLAGNM